MLNPSNNKPFAISFYGKLLLKKFYYGIMEIKGVEYPHIYEPLIPKSLYDECHNERTAQKKQCEHPCSYNAHIRSILLCIAFKKEVSLISKVPQIFSKRLAAPGPSGIIFLPYFSSFLYCSCHNKKKDPKMYDEWRRQFDRNLIRADLREAAGKE